MHTKTRSFTGKMSRFEDELFWPCDISEAFMERKERLEAHDTDLEKASCVIG